MSWMRGLYRTAPLFVASGSGAEFVDVDGHRYLDFNVCDLSMTLGYAPGPIVSALRAQAALGNHFLLPTEDAIAVAEILSDRTGVPFWQFTLSASGANVEVIRIARAITRRAKIVVFEGYYHGHLDDMLVDRATSVSDRSRFGVHPLAGQDTIVVTFNDLSALEHALSGRDVALVLTEPALTNCNVVLADPGFLAGVRHLTKQAGTLYCLDEAHTFQFAWGGLTRTLEQDPDFLVLGKGLGTGISAGLYGTSESIAAEVNRQLDYDIGPRGIPTGGTTYASALTTAALRAALTELLTPDAYQRTCALGAALADGLEAIFRTHNLDWRAFRCGPRSGWCLDSQLPRNGQEAARSLDYLLIDARRAFMANRGIWDAVASAGPQASFAHTAADIDRYLQVAREFVEAVVAP